MESIFYPQDFRTRDPENSIKCHEIYDKTSQLSVRNDRRGGEQLRTEACVAPPAFRAGPAPLFHTPPPLLLDWDWGRHAPISVLSIATACANGGAGGMASGTGFALPPPSASYSWPAGSSRGLGPGLLASLSAPSGLWPAPHPLYLLGQGQRPMSGPHCCFGAKPACLPTLTASGPGLGQLPSTPPPQQGQACSPTSFLPPVQCWAGARPVCPTPPPIWVQPFSPMLLQA